MYHSGDLTLVEQFVNITGVSESRAQALLGVCNGNLEMAIGMHLEGTELPSVHVHTHGESTSHVNVGEENIRAPIPQTRGILCDGPYRVSRPRRRGNQSVFDAFRDFQAEAKEQELELNTQGTKNKRKTLQDLFKPPLDIIHKGSFDTAKVAGERNCKWLIVNIQDSKEFKCQQLNRDVWSNESVRNILDEHFILWQVYRDSDDGDRYIQFYHVSKFPHLAVLDPRTGEKLVEWNTIDAQSFCEVATEFLMNHTLGAEANGCFPPASKRRKRESIIDASEDSQLEAAIAASLKETSTEQHNSEHIPDEDSLTEFSGSDSDPEVAVDPTSPKKQLAMKANITRSEKAKEIRCEQKKAVQSMEQRCDVTSDTKDSGSCLKCEDERDSGDNHHQRLIVEKKHLLSLWRWIKIICR